MNKKIYSQNKYIYKILKKTTVIFYKILNTKIKKENQADMY
jgi:hypothetical protein